jgi:predicted nucleotidyltransferase
MSWNIQDLTFDYYPRDMWTSHVRAYLYCNLLPSQSAKEINKVMGRDPSIVYTISPKNYTANTNSYLSYYSDVEKFSVSSNNYGIQLNITAQKCKPIWFGYVKNNQWYLNQLKAHKISRLLKLLPGVKNIYLTGSSALEISSISSDIDLIIETYRGQVWISRFWVKVCLKILRLDVHDIFLEFRISFNHLLRTSRFISQEKYRILISHLEDQIWNKKKKGGLVDVGLFYENHIDIEKIFPKETRNLYIWSSLKILNLSQKYDQSNRYGGSLLYWSRKSVFYSICSSIFKHSLSFISFLMCPILSLQYYFYIKRAKNYIYFVLKKDFICYFPIIFKPKSILEYQIKNR